MTAVFVKLGLPEDDARLCSDVLMQSDKWGIESHGCNRFKPIYVDRIRKGILNPVTKTDVLKETPTIAVLDANDGMGMVASKKFFSLWDCRLLGESCCKRKYDRNYRNECKAIHCSYFWCGKHDGNQSPDLCNAYG